MLKEERQRRILAILRERANARTIDIAMELNVSRETVRRDLVELQGEGEIGRVHGGATINSSPPEEPFQLRMQLHRTEKLAIARRTASLLKDGEAVFLDAGTTTTILAEILRDGPDVQVITNLQSAATLLRDRAFMLGGRFSDSVPATFGELTLANIRSFHVDVAIISPTGVDPEWGLSYYDVHECAVARAMCDQAQRTTVLADSSKIGVSSRVRLDGIETTDILVTDRHIDADLHAKLAKHVQVVLAP
ncbi:DeoR/GlpR family DNA-binding transcription regulator [Microbaculum marinisediminis]|uniref:DeoR/GlpR family DNA-binding transcription regulator n=1 Tax=Microbaculum marinisediminis TaxID=2931392 RepID=A0AAW5R1X3_9HYPH|nr:DeoR/GlpR family DNA-binding transcription regulator [Microbaculum sp. A6E488]MCT8974286.1 DeoR/GlpR family DNA-binding transcription regulator [Microbaculum sp. A6E488]